MKNPETPRLRFAVIGWVVSGVVAPLATALILLLLAPQIQQRLEGPSCDDPKELRLADPIGATSVSESSEALGGVLVTHAATLAIDGDTGTAWVEGELGYGAGAGLVITLPAGTDLQLICIANGYLKSEDLYLQNARIRQLEVETDRGALTAVIPDKSVADYATFQEVRFVAGPTDKVTFTIRTTNAGQAVNDLRFEDTALSELEFWSK